MAYPQNLQAWAVTRIVPPTQWVIISCYYTCSDPEEHLQLWRQRVPNTQFDLVFDLPDSTNYRDL
ncbi:MAG: hypothetical protein F6K37_41100 [Moorea sp. SIO4E2]|uniref:hypothetical protein n=1 Tax=Moorena sp. SIO4E2 TaxID=2607826 RepID=UPI0013B8A618|nr:hypothetical protein [Moorena sp. SIO4E2]NEQ12033.1 hypothetical protein [Moorena sp. SIO4E2]